jgi:hypothetical protein
VPAAENATHAGGVNATPDHPAATEVADLNSHVSNTSSANTNHDDNPTSAPPSTIPESQAVPEKVSRAPSFTSPLTAIAEEGADPSQSEHQNADEEEDEEDEEEEGAEPPQLRVRLSIPAVVDDLPPRRDSVVLPAIAVQAGPLEQHIMVYASLIFSQ